jgi:hypothetical protein
MGSDGSITNGGGSSCIGGGSGDIEGDGFAVDINPIFL